MNTCSICGQKNPEKGRAFDGRRAYRCSQCGNEWTKGMQGRSKKYSIQRSCNQFNEDRLK